MNYQIIKLTDFFPSIKLTQKFEPTLTAYCPDNSPEIDMKRLRPSVLICPGGGYAYTSEREAEPVALQFLARGCNAFVLRYSCSPERYPAALLEVSAAVALIRRRAAEFNADPHKIAVCGFSAGGHLATCAGLLWNEPFIADTLKIEKRDNRPDGMILCYSVITSGEKAHRDSFDALLGKNADQQVLAKLSLENRVHDDVPPAFIWHTFEDSCVPVENSLFLASALRKHNIPFELHIYPYGDHGLSLCTSEVNGNKSSNPHCSTWVGLAGEWIKLTFGK